MLLHSAIAIYMQFKITFPDSHFDGLIYFILLCISVIHNAGNQHSK